MGRTLADRIIRLGRKAGLDPHLSCKLLLFCLEAVDLCLLLGYRLVQLLDVTQSILFPGLLLLYTPASHSAGRWQVVSSGLQKAGEHMNASLTTSASHSDRGLQILRTGQQEAGRHTGRHCSRQDGRLRMHTGMHSWLMSHHLVSRHWSRWAGCTAARRECKWSGGTPQLITLNVWQTCPLLRCGLQKVQSWLWGKQSVPRKGWPSSAGRASTHPTHLHLGSSLFVIFPDAGILLLQPFLFLLHLEVVLCQVLLFLLQLRDLLSQLSVLLLDLVPVFHCSVHLAGLELFSLRLQTSKI